ncbi:MAG: hypothetical protein ACD_17C00541G0003 [uncultured bacterium]|nr:MAG: hypothetical protein ACD_17C00541G0003 [uncultured bacterium]OGN56349.1 MAG: hypothetical protein A2796_02885 [Chlamydiae bacterium RIFCSPHIGHO2_01_FULL_44_39]OGN60259.1 MAG: hypothetical protein A3D96_05455 [Chlamydiae bacterium RIFCSPHIGHO2_12_FULL_44_59]OGN67088.1 MAG: hypothetical protein A2978_00590 [Chlamydiae bacterium RIFCSPLOWO2_01_FULL_44_52]OGN67678.1 MAG: hypothetical protein A3I67_04525 [Chlamydiae bacterium RIFCSPLOWO2_02_FULL_45_22]OGN71381.1 MAG: hypothetical protein A3
MNILIVVHVFLAVFSTWSLHAGLQTHFRPVEGKTTDCFNQVQNIDFIYLINLDQRPEKWAHCLNELAPYHIQPYRFSAVNGWELSLEVLNQLGVKYSPQFCKNLWGTAYLPEDNFQPHHEIMQVVGRNYFCHCMSRGAIGIVLSHLSILQDAYDSGYETIWVLEDDIEVIQNPHLLSDLITRLDNLVGKGGWDILFTDQDTKGQDGNYIPCYDTARRPDFIPLDEKRLRLRGNVSADFRRIGVRYGAYSMIIRRSGMKKILDFYREHNIFLPYDMEYYFPQNILFYTVRSDVISTQPRAPSDNGSPGYLRK